MKEERGDKIALICDQGFHSLVKHWKQISQRQVTSCTLNHREREPNCLNSLAAVSLPSHQTHILVF